MKKKTSPLLKFMAINIVMIILLQFIEKQNKFQQIWVKIVSVMGTKGVVQYKDAE